MSHDIAYSGWYRHEMANTYWYHHGKYQKEYNLLCTIYIETYKVHLTDNTKVNDVIKKLICGVRKYYRYYVDGVYPGMGVPPIFAIWDVEARYRPDRVKILEEAIDKLILDAWKVTKHANILPTHDVYKDDIYCPDISPQSHSNERRNKKHVLKKK
jgi:hypothetical protein